MTLTNIEMNVLAVALDHMEEHIQDLISENDFMEDHLQERLDACKNLQIKLL